MPLSLSCLEQAAGYLGTDIFSSGIYTICCIFDAKVILFSQNEYINLFFYSYQHNLLFVLFKKPVLHSFNTIGYKPGGAVVSTSEMGEEQMIAFRTHLVSFCLQLFLWQGHIPCRLSHLAALTAPQLHGLSLQRT